MINYIKSLFPNTLLIPLIAPSDLYPQGYNPFEFSIATENIRLNPFTYRNEQQPDIDAKAYLEDLVSYMNTNVLP